MNENKLKEYIAHTCDCNYCRKIGIDSKKCSGDCVEELLNYIKNKNYNVYEELYKGIKYKFEVEE